MGPASGLCLSSWSHLFLTLELVLCDQSQVDCLDVVEKKLVKDAKV